MTMDGEYNSRKLHAANLSAFFTIVAQPGKMHVTASISHYQITAATCSLTSGSGHRSLHIFPSQSAPSDTKVPQNQVSFV